jgi:hypothetical protein
MGKKRSSLLYGEVNDIPPAEVHPSEEIDNLLSTFERYGIDIYEDVFSAKAARIEKTLVKRRLPDSRRLLLTGC